MDNQTARSRTVVAQLFAQWEHNASQYSAVTYSAAFAKNEETWTSLTTLFTPSPQLGGPDDLLADYGSFLMMRGHLSLADAKATLTRVIEEGRLYLPDGPEVELKPGLESTMVRWQGSQHQQFPIKYSATEYHFIVPNIQTNLPLGRICRPGLPLYPHAYAAIAHRLGIRIANPNTTELIALAPDYRARVRKVSLSSSAATVFIEAMVGAGQQILGKTYFEDSQGRMYHHDLDLREGTAIFSTGSNPQSVGLVLLSRETGDVIDEWVFNAMAPVNPGAEIEVREDDVENLILGGESETLEFKRQMTAGAEIAISVSGFANSTGGRIIIGVSDDGEVVGCEGGLLQDRLSQIVDKHCDPAPTFSLASALIREKHLWVIAIREGHDKPYLVRDKGIYVRSGSTTRRASRYEIDRMYGSKVRPAGLGPSFSDDWC
jgi:hypothetical protein